MEYEVRQLDPYDSWKVEAIDYGNEGVIYQALFTGPDAKKRAEEYAAWKQGAANCGGKAH